MLLAIHPVLMARDVAASMAFFERLGFAPVFVDDVMAPRYAALRREGCELHLQWQQASQWVGGQDRPTYRFLVADVDALFEAFGAAGALPEPAESGGPWSRPGDTPWGTREFHLRDPGGNGLQFYRPR